MFFTNEAGGTRRLMSYLEMIICVYNTQVRQNYSDNISAHVSIVLTRICEGRVHRWEQLFGILELIILLKKK